MSCKNHRSNSTPTNLEMKCSEETGGNGARDVPALRGTNGVNEKLSYKQKEKSSKGNNPKDYGGQCNRGLEAAYL